ncbi:hypothetical protein [Nocardioides campestrisoli]|uniref:hypothetical protein n=1 Tax=Nocardioides campestrisoli TaxID=2736757 RepID=UPI0015E799D8|nr:hypothetical protein [Nocardioides campestrisoli]
MSRLLRVVALLAPPALLAGALAAPVPAAAPPPESPVLVSPVGELPPGPPISGPHLEGRRTLVDGDVRIRVPADILVVGRTGRAYIVEEYRGNVVDVLRVTRDGKRRTLAKGVDGSQLSADGSLLTTSRLVRFRTEVQVLDARTGRVRARRTVNEGVWALGVDERRVLLGGVGGSLGGTHLWFHRAGRIKRLSNQSAYIADLAAGLYARHTDDADQYSGGCTVIAKIGSGKELWRNCGASVDDFSADGRSVLMRATLDGTSARVRTIRGKRVLRYAVRYPDSLDYAEWDTDGRVLLHVEDEDGRSVVVACSDLECTRPTTS